MKNKLNSFLICALAMLPLGHAMAQEHAKSEIGVHGGIGLSTLKYDPKNMGEQKNGFGGNFGIDYTYFFSPKVGIKTGLEMARYAAKVQLTSNSGKYIANDGEENFEFRYLLNPNEEKQSATYLNIPLMVQLQLPVSSAHFFYIAGGGKIGFPTSSNASSNDVSLKALGYYAESDALLGDKDQITSNGFGRFTAAGADKDLELKTAFMLALETGMKWGISPSLSLYTGVYADYGLNNVADNTTGATPLIQYNAANPSNYTVNSIITSGVAGKNYVEKVTPLAAGLKVRLSFGLGGSSSKSNNSSYEPPKQETKQKHYEPKESKEPKYEQPKYKEYKEPKYEQPKETKYQKPKYQKAPKVKQEKRKGNEYPFGNGKTL